MITTKQFIEDNKWTEEKILNLKSGDKLIFIVDGEMLSDKKGYVYTFEKWHESDYWNRLKFWKSKECMDKYPEHNLQRSLVQFRLLEQTHRRHRSK